MIKNIGVALFCLAVLTGCAKKEEPAQTNDQISPPETQAVPVVAMAEAAPEAEAAEMAEMAPAAAPEVEVTQTPAAETAPPVVPTKLGDAAYPLTGLTWVKGEPAAITLGKVYVVEFWATWCPPCRQSIPHLTELQKKYADQGVVFIGVSNEKVPTVKPFVADMAGKMDYHVAVDEAGAVVGGYMVAFGQNGIPTAFVVDAKGKVVWFGHPMGDLDKVIGQVLAGTYQVPG